MKKRQLVLLAIVVLGVALGLWLLGPVHDNYVYEGKSVEEWSVQLFGAPSQAGREEARAAFRRMGSAAVPGLMKQLRTRDPFFRKQLWTLSSHLPARARYRLLGRTKDLEAATLRAAAARSLGIIGAAAAPAASELSLALRDRQTQVSLDAATALGHIGTAGVPELARALSDGDPSVRHMAAYGLGEAGPVATSAIPALLKGLTDQNEYVRGSSAYSLSKIGEPARQAVLEAIAHAHGPEREAAARALAGFNSSIQESTPPLLGMMADADPACRSQAINTLSLLRAFDNRVITNLANALKDPASEVRLAATKALSEASWKAQPAIPSLIERLNDSTALVRVNAAQALGKIGPPAKSALAALTDLSEEKNAAVRDAAQQAIVQIEGRGMPRPDNLPR